MLTFLNILSWIAIMLLAAGAIGMIFQVFITSSLAIIFFKIGLVCLGLYSVLWIIMHFLMKSI